MKCLAPQIQSTVSQTRERLALATDFATSTFVMITRRSSLALFDSRLHLSHLVRQRRRQETMQSAHRIVATLETIPTDLKLMIADHFGPDVPLDLRWSRVAQREARTRRGTLASLSLISRSWASALEGLRWKVRCARPPCGRRRRGYRIKLKYSRRADSTHWRTKHASSAGARS